MARLTWAGLFGYLPYFVKETDNYDEVRGYVDNLRWLIQNRDGCKITKESDKPVPECVLQALGKQYSVQTLVDKLGWDENDLDDAIINGDLAV